MAMVAAVGGHRTGPLHRMAVAVAAVAIVLDLVGIATRADHLVVAALLLLASGSLVLGAELVTAPDRSDLPTASAAGAAAIAVAVAVAGGPLGNWTTPTVGTAAMSVLLAAAAAVLAFSAFVHAVRAQEHRRDALALSRQLEIARLSAAHDRHAEIAHDQRSALLAIEAAAETLRRAPRSDLADAVCAEARRLQRMLDADDDDLGCFDVGSVLGPTTAFLANLHGPIDLEVVGDCRAWGRVDDVAEIVRAVIGNAFDHGAAPVAVRVHADADHVRIAVHDQGDGVPMALREVIFERSVSSRPDVHSGLGLYAARRLARANGGDLTLRDEPDTVFELRLPTRPVPRVAEPGGGRVIDLRSSTAAAETADRPDDERATR